MYDYKKSCGGGKGAAYLEDEKENGRKDGGKMEGNANPLVARL